MRRRSQTVPVGLGGPVPSVKMVALEWYCLCSCREMAGLQETKVTQI